MKKAILYILGVACFMIIVSCEKVIEIKLNEADQKIVVEAIVSNDTTQNYVILSKSGGFYQSNNFDAITGANVRITQVGGASFVLTETEPGYYTNSSLIGQLKTSYQLEVVTDNQTITAETFLPGTTQMDSLTYYNNNGQFGSKGYTVLTNFKDDVNEKNYYRYKVSINGSKEGSIMLLDDLLINGKATQYPLFQVEFNKFDSVVCEFIEIDKPTYEYFTALIDVIGGSGSTSAAPGNPPNNLSGDALGFFGGYAITRSSIVIVP